MFNSNSEARDFAREVVSEYNRQGQYEGSESISDAAAMGIIATGFAVAGGIMYPATYIAAATFIGASLFPIGAVLTGIGAVGVGVKVLKGRKEKKRGQ